MSDVGGRVMVTVSEIASRDEISKQAVSKTLQKLIRDHGIPVEYDTRGRVSRFSLSHYDHHRARYVDPARRSPVTDDQGIAPKAGGAAPKADSFDEARRIGEWLKVEREQLRQAEERAKLVRVDALGVALAAIGREIQTLVAKLPNSADDLAISVSREGAHGLRTALRTLAFEINTAIAERLASIAVDAPEVDPETSDVDA